MRGPKPKKVVSEKWSGNLAYAIGLLASDGCLAKSSSLIDLTSNDKEQLTNYLKCLKINAKISKKKSGSGRFGLRVQFKNRVFHSFLLKIGLTPAKSKTLGPLNIPDKYFFDFLRGVFDGDGCTYSYWDKRWKSSFMYYVCFSSASPSFLDWLQNSILRLSGVKGHITTAGEMGKYFQLKYAKIEGLQVLRKMYHSKNIVYLKRKYLKIGKTLAIVGQKI